MKLTIVTGPDYDNLYECTGLLANFHNREVRLQSVSDMDKYPALKKLYDTLDYRINLFLNDLYDGYSGVLLDEHCLHNSHITLFADAIVELVQAGFVFVVTTQSDVFINAIRVAVKEKRIDPSEVCIKFYGETYYEPKIDSDGRIDVWNKGFMDELNNLLMKLL